MSEYLIRDFGNGGDCDIYGVYGGFCYKFLLVKGHIKQEKRKEKEKRRDF